MLWNGLWLYHPDIDEQVIIADTYYHDDIGRPKHGDLRIRYIPKSQCFVIDKYTRYVDEVANVHRWRWKVHDILKHDPTKGR